MEWKITINNNSFFISYFISKILYGLILFIGSLGQLYKRFHCQCCIAVKNLLNPWKSFHNKKSCHAPRCQMSKSCINMGYKLCNQLGVQSTSPSFEAFNFLNSSWISFSMSRISFGFLYWKTIKRVFKPTKVYTFFVIPNSLISYINW